MPTPAPEAKKAPKNSAAMSAAPASSSSTLSQLLGSAAGYAQQAASMRPPGAGVMDSLAGYLPSWATAGGGASQEAQRTAGPVAPAGPQTAQTAATTKGAAPTPAAATPAAATAAATTAPAKGDPLALGLGKVGKVRYKDERFLKGNGDLTAAETKKLTTGADDIEAANCSTFTTWMLAAAGYDMKSKPKGALGNLQAYVNIAVGTETGKLKDDIAADTNNIKGPAAGFVALGIGVEVPKGEAKPGDFLQTWSKGGGGHSTVLHRVHCKGAAIFGLPGSPKLNEGEAPAGGGPLGAATPVSFTLDETTDPKLVGAHTVDKVEKLGAHLGGKNSEGKENQDGVYTTKATSLTADYYKAYLGRLNDSRWANFKPADVAAWKAPKATVPAADTSAKSDTTSSGGGLAGWLTGMGTSALSTAGSMMGGMFGVGSAERTEAPKAPATASAPAATRTTAAAQPFEAKGVRGCDYRVQPDGTIQYMKAGKVARSFTKSDPLHAKIKSEILEVYPALANSTLS